MQLFHSARNGWLAALAIAALAIGTPAFATRTLQPQVTGQVTAIAGETAISVNGKQYLIAAGSAAYSSVQTLHVGDQVGLILDGPANSAASHVIAILSPTSRQH
jgi:hypothetical protein